MLARFRQYSARMRQTIVSVFWHSSEPLQKHAVGEEICSYSFEAMPHEAFDALPNAEKLFTHHMAKAINSLKLILFHQNSYESAAVFGILYELFSENDLAAISEKAKEAEFDEAELKALIDYAVRFFDNVGNVRGCGVMLPNFDKHKFQKLVSDLPIVGMFGDQPLAKMVNSMFSDDALRNSPMTSNLLSEDCARILEFLTEHDLPANNCRVFKYDESPVRYELLFPSVEVMPAVQNTKELPQASDGASAPKKARHSAEVFDLKFGDYGKILAKSCKFLNDAKVHANETQARMVTLLLDELSRASSLARSERMELFLNTTPASTEVFVNFYSQSPRIRSCIDQRQLGAFIGIINSRYQSLLDAVMAKQEMLNAILKWEPGYLETSEASSKPQFLFLDIAACAFADGLPIGMNFSDKEISPSTKNVMANIISPSLCVNQSLLMKNRNDFMGRFADVLLLDVILHEFVGHTQGDLLFRLDDEGNAPTVKNMISGEQVKSSEVYGAEEGYESRFAEIDVVYEELRAESIMLLMGVEGTAASAFGQGSACLSTLLVHHSVSKGLLQLLCTTHAENGSLQWPDDHSRAFFALTGFLDTIPELIVLDQENGLFDINHTVIPDMITALVNFIRRLQTYKATGDVVSARQLVSDLSAPSERLQSWRSHVEAVIEWPPNSIWIGASSRIQEFPEGGNTAEQIIYPLNAQGYLQSVIDQFSEIYDGSALYEQWHSDTERLANSSHD